MRTGSTFLGQILSRLSNTINLGEIFNTDISNIHRRNSNIDFYNSIRPDQNLSDIDSKKLWQNILEVYSTKDIICKIHYHQLIDHNLEWLFSAPNNYFILLHRQNKIYQYTSQFIAGITNQYHNYNTNDIQVYIPVEEFVTFQQDSFNNIQHLKSILQQYNCNYLEITYEIDLENIDIDKIDAKINTWLKANSIDSTIDTSYIEFNTKQNTRSINEIIKNYQDVQPYIIQATL